jgi:hypothetical protein
VNRFRHEQVRVCFMVDANEGGRETAREGGRERGRECVSCVWAVVCAGALGVGTEVSVL